jgi:ABC-2 type transport system ATP-binding protein
MSDTLLSVRELWKSYRRGPAVKGVSFELVRGRITAFLGENGAGKTTTIKMILGLLRKDRGEIISRAIRIGYVSEQPSFFPWLTGADVLGCTAALHGLSRKDAGERIRDGCERFRFNPGLLKKKTVSYSNGTKKKLAFLQNMLLQPDLLVVDEPFSALDPPAIREARSLLQSCRNSGGAVLLSSHLIAEAQKSYDAVILIKKGEIVIAANRESLGPDPDLERLFFQGNGHF